MRKCLYNCRWNFGQACFAVISVFYATRVPYFLECTFDVSLCICYELVGKNLRSIARKSCPQCRISLLCSTNRQCSNRSSVSFHASIAMHAQRQFYWNPQSFLVRNVGRTARKPVCIKRTCVYIVVVIVCSVASTDYIARCTGPLCVVSCSFKCAGQATDLSSSNNVSHTATKANSICGNKTSVLAVVG